MQLLPNTVAAAQSAAQLGGRKMAQRGELEIDTVPLYWPTETAPIWPTSSLQPNWAQTRPRAEKERD